MNVECMVRMDLCMYNRISYIDFYISLRSERISNDFLTTYVSIVTMYERGQSRLGEKSQRKR